MHRKSIDYPTDRKPRLADWRRMSEALNPGEPAEDYEDGRSPTSSIDGSPAIGTLFGVDSTARFGTLISTMEMKASRVWASWHRDLTTLKGS